MKSLQTAELGFNAARREIEIRGGIEIEALKEGNKRFITYTGLDGDRYTITTRSKSKGDWQTSINYGGARKENPMEREFWLFIDLEIDPPRFYPVPLWWIENDIHTAFQALLRKHGGRRARNDKSTHHAVRLPRIRRWESRWSEMAL